MDWNNIHIFLAVYRSGTLRGAAQELNISHSTISRHLDAFETRMGVKLFDRVKGGLAITSAGESLLTSAERIEAEIDFAQRKLTGLDRKISGVIKVSMIDVMATHLLMPDLAEFKRLYPAVDFDIQVTYDSVDLDRREADIALRFTKNPPEHLIGQRLSQLAIAPYATPQYIASHDLSNPQSASWIGYGAGQKFPGWVKNSDYPHLPAKGIYADKLVQLAAAKQGMGIAILPCFVGEQEPSICMLPDAKPRLNHELWLLRHQDTRTSARLHAFSRFITERIKNHKAELECHQWQAAEHR